MGLKGNLASTTLADVFQALSQSHATGLLRVQAPEGSRYVEIQEGAISIVSRTPKRIPIGDLLVARGLLEKEDLQKGLALQKETGKLLGEVLVGQNLVKMEDLEEALRFQVEEEICELFLLKSADFDFLANANLDAKMALGGGFTRLKIDPNAVMLEAAKGLEEWKALEQRLPSQAVAFQLTETGQETLSSKQGLSPEGLMLLQLVHDKRSVESMVQKACLGRLNTNLLLVELWDAGLIEPLPDGAYAQTALEHMKDGRMEEAERMARYGLTLKEAGTHKEILENILADVGKKRKLAEGVVSSGARVRSEVIRRPSPSLIIQKKRSPLPLIVAGLVVVILAGGGAWWYFTGRTESSISKDKMVQFGAWVNQINGLKAQRKYHKVIDLFQQNWRDPVLRKRAKEKYNNTLRLLETELSVCLETARAAFRSGEEKKIAGAYKEFKLFETLGIFSDDLQDDLEDFRDKFRVWKDRALTQEFEKRLAKAEGVKGCSDRVKAYRDILTAEPAPPEKVAVKIRQRLALLAGRKRNAEQALVKGQVCLACGDLLAAKHYLSQVSGPQGFPGSGLAKKVEAMMEALDQKTQQLNRQLNRARNLFFRGQGKEARKELQKFFQAMPPPHLAKRALDIMFSTNTPQIEEAADRMRREVLALEGRKQAGAARKKKLELLKKFPYSRAASKLTLKVHVNSQPPGAKVWINDLPNKELTPTTIFVPAMGLARITFRKEGYEEVESGGWNFRQPSCSATLFRRPAKPPIRLPGAALGGLAAHGDWVVILHGTEAVFYDQSQAPGAPLLRKELGRTTASEDPYLKDLPPLHDPVFVTDQALECLVATNQRSVLRINMKNRRARRVSLESAPLGPLVSFVNAKRTFIGAETQEGLECWDLTDGRKRFPPVTLESGETQRWLGHAFDGERFLVARSDGKLYQVNAQDGKSVSWPLPEKALGPPAAHESGPSVALITETGKVLVWDSSAQKEAKRYEKDLGAKSTLGLMACPKGFVACTADGGVHLLAPGKDKLLWSKKLNVPAVLRPVAVGTSQLAVATPKELLLLETEKGAVVWRASLPAQPVALASEGPRIHVSTKDGFLLTFETE